MATVVNFTQWPWHHWAQLNPNETAIIFGDSPITWQQLSCHINQLANHLAKQGVNTKSTVLLRGKNHIHVVFTLLAVFQCGAKVLPLDPQLPKSLLDDLLPHLNIDFYADLSGSTLELDARLLDLSGVEFNNKSHQDKNNMAGVAWASSRMATLILTSGSSGLPKAAVHTFQAHLCSAEGVLELIPFEKSDSWLLSLPLFHVSGQGILWRWLLRGATLVVRNMHPFIAALQGCTHASLVPTQLWRLLQNTQQDSSQPITLKAVLLGGAMIPTELTQCAESKGIQCWCGYGMTEMASTVCAKRADGKAGVGTPLKGKAVRLVDNEIQIKSDSVALGYWFDGQLKPLSHTQDDWYATRDRGCFKEGEWCILGRLDNLFFSAGEGIQPEDIEKVLNSHPNVRQTFIVPIDDIEFGQRPVAVVDTDIETINQLPQWYHTRLAGFQRPIACLLLPEQLKSGGIKISRKQVQQWVKGQQVN
ncbi:TPA: o-succinylbenzoate--CoA ligase [Proteus mirabilis]|uniref:o-succinylbenzoate--CoA ligase n=1 Tax=Proteus mirabilis TaxID=584 RepID=UPI000D5296FA|nr:o-succinylbenzoate--CoA ligase [Proteus mirabilis]AWF40159.1 O-succinylbenzoate-CoA ligase [Proteus mirabilis]EKU3801056.1 o-succinylbenzoate--CoA ligase [Proteus mirabilis]EKU6441945.1 o-succinylbenzoate--CoA ligase [Proteus mirabilis]EKU6781193.1 o-succinylbenzoate--CoA ligase [Proteus mirabilis]EKU7262361.1 o-succinylbenzoate--CoA ligase [Proteus mirabilis]